MEDYARDECARYLRDCEDESSFKDAPKIRRGLELEGADVLLIHDDTMFKSGKNGFAITTDGFVCREFGDKSAHSVSWEELAELPKPIVDDSYVRAGRKSIVYNTDGDDELYALHELSVKIHRHAQHVFGR